MKMSNTNAMRELNRLRLKTSKFLSETPQLITIKLTEDITQKDYLTLLETVNRSKPKTIVILKDEATSERLTNMASELSMAMMRKYKRPTLLTL